MASPLRHPAGTPSGGQFAPARRQEADLRLVPTPPAAPTLDQPVRWVDDENGGALARLSYDRFVSVEESGDRNVPPYNWSAGIADWEGSEAEHGHADTFEDAKAQAESMLAARYPVRRRTPEEEAELDATWGADPFAAQPAPADPPPF